MALASGGPSATPSIFTPAPGGPGANGSTSAETGAEQREASQPLRSVVVIMTDDQPASMLSGMSNVERLLGAHGVVFTDAFASSPFCCPSRASFLSGNYPHTTGVRSNREPNGGFASFKDDSTIATWFQPTHTTGLFGKYLNEYRSGALDGYVPPGWDRWVAFKSSNGAYYDYDVIDDGATKHHGDAPKDYSTTAFADEAVRFIRSTEGPLLVLYAPYAPHMPALPGPAAKPGPVSVVPHLPEESLGDKPAWVRERPRAPEPERLAQLERRMRISLQPVDRAVGRLVAALKATGRLDSTAIVFTSDNGFLLGEHNISGKEAPYDEATKVPLVIRADWLVSKPRTQPGLISNVDLAPTLAAMAGVDAPSVEGQDMTRFIAGKAHGRQSLYLEYNDNGGATGAGRASFCAIRTKKYLFVNYTDDRDEFYDLERDPNAWRNAVHASRYAELRSRLRENVASVCTPGAGIG